MFGDIGFSELLIIAFVVILVVRPGDLPVIMRRIGVFYAFIQSFIGGIWGGWQEKLEGISEQNQSSAQGGRQVGGKGNKD